MGIGQMLHQKSMWLGSCSPSCFPKAEILAQPQLL